MTLKPEERDALVGRLKSLRTVLDIDSPETRGWAPVVQQEARRVVEAAIAALAPQPQPAERVTLASLRGIAKGALGGMSSEEYVEGQRDGWAAERVTAEQPAAAPVAASAAADALEYASRLALNIAHKFYPEVPQFRPLSDTLGVLTQIDNMTSGLSRITAVPQAATAVRLGAQQIDEIWPRFLARNAGVRCIHTFARAVERAVLAANGLGEKEEH